MQNSTCTLCGQTFPISDGDLAFYEKIGVPLPKLCPKDRLKRRLSFRNERSLYKRKCDKTGKEVISNMRPDAPVVVYDLDAWHKDDWNPPVLPSFDFKKGFFEQFASLDRMSPHMHKASAGNEVNSPYMNHAGNSKNCYYTFNAEYNQDCMYLRFADHCQDCADSNNILNSELCYECVNVENGYRLFFSDDCKLCRDSVFLRFCRGVSNSIFCYGLEKKEYHIFNEPYTKEEFIQKLQEMRLNTYEGLQSAIHTWNEWSKQFPLRRQIILNCDNSTRDTLYNCKNAQDCYNCSKLQDCRYVLNTVEAKDIYDMYAYGEVELGYECVSVMKNYNTKFVTYVFNSDNMEYCDNCWACHFCFGCAGLKGRSYCIFNKQYPKEEYMDLVKKIKDKMIADGEYGEFFPISMSPFPYEDTMAHDYFPESEKVIAAPIGDYLTVDTLPDDSRDIDPVALSKNSYL